mmetsp:Transcript_20423/g.42644  ORF Transcript_20423/g.42644 Transcript_20423/m.42644 type:complete len:431 (+) Transcript_20423:134-1426(+)|eukprot:CAMPEP_0201131456 /NCGR_PEP_ID=MMETSP0850-20130426/42822_1 /ASSEMBLY_ACC=CAM_ASM_000622 /TAXON_ID=183588 /ORGANISM="Pseudo-nitzschia fraudulenta, Strain WWA7" /LENGTH=430 /DNA_ID=CAMNT_0047401499 /DNA_START=97 /DNA_END=1389 /DNA_ORIENTATION=-
MIKDDFLGNLTDNIYEASEGDEEGGEAIDAKAPTPTRVVIGVFIFVYAVSIVLHIISFLGITLPLITDPAKRTPSASFNLYLAFLIMADLVFAVLTVARYAMASEHKVKDTSVSFMGGLIDISEICNSIFPAMFWCWGLMFWVSGFVCHELLKLLENSKQRKRCRPPTIRQVMCQGFLAFFIGFILSVVEVVSENWLRYIQIVLIFLPIVYSLWVVFRIVSQGLMGYKANVGCRLTVLVIYFARIFCAYTVLMCSMVIIEMIVSTCPKKHDEQKMAKMLRFINHIIWGLQGWISFRIILAKPDISKMVSDLFATKACSRKRLRTEQDDREDKAILRTAMRRLSSITRMSQLNADTERDRNDDGECMARSRRPELKRIARAFILGVDDYLSDEEESTTGVDGGDNDSDDDDSDDDDSDEDDSDDDDDGSCI